MGSLRAYLGVEGGPASLGDEVHRLVQRAGMRSECTCEICGVQGVPRRQGRHGVVGVRCEAHAGELDHVLSRGPPTWTMRDPEGRWARLVYDRERDEVTSTPLTEAEGRSAHPMSDDGEGGT